MPAESREARTAGIVVLATLAVLGARLLAVPLLATLKIKGDHIDSLAPLAEFLGVPQGLAASSRYRAGRQVTARRCGPA